MGSLELTRRAALANPGMSSWAALTPHATAPCKPRLRRRSAIAFHPALDTPPSALDPHTPVSHESRIAALYGRLDTLLDMLDAAGSDTLPPKLVAALKLRSLSSLPEVAGRARKPTLEIFPNLSP